MSLKKLGEKVAKQSALIFGGKPKDRRKNRSKRQFIDEIIRGVGQAYPDRKREEIATDVTYTIQAMRELYESVGVEEFVNVLFHKVD